MKRLALILVLTIAPELQLVRGDPPAPADSALFGAIPMVEAASLHSQSLREAPADVSIVTEQDIRRYGYRTLNDALMSVRGFFSSSDRIYNFVGVRGFSLPGDYNTRFLVMLNGHPLTDQVYDSNGFFGQDLGIDMDLVARIEVIRGPSSALYGSNGMLANINIVTKSPVDSERLRVSMETGTLGEKKAEISSSVYLGHGLNLLFSGSMFLDQGSDLRFPGIPSAVSGVNGERGYHTFANLVWRNWSFTAYFNARSKQPPVPWTEESILFQKGDYVRDSRNFVQGGWTGNAGAGKLAWQLYYDQYRYDDRFFQLPSAIDEIADLRLVNHGDSLGTQATWQTEVNRLGEFTVGAQFDVQLKNLQQNHTVSPRVTYDEAILHPDLREGLFLQQQWRISSSLAAYGGLRLDNSRNFGSSLSPRVALVYQYSPATTYKLVYGRPFRNPSAFERFYKDDVGFIDNADLHSEAAQTIEGSVQRKLWRNVVLTGGFYDYRLSDLIQANFLDSGIQRFANTSFSHSSGLECELNAKAWDTLELDGSYSYGRSALDGDATARSAPRHLAKFRSAIPVAHGRLWLSGSFQYMSSRRDVDDAGLRPVVLADFTVTSGRLLPDCEITAGIRNVAGWRYSDPTALSVHQMPADGRSLFVKVTFGLKQ